MDFIIAGIIIISIIIICKVYNYYKPQIEILIDDNYCITDNNHFVIVLWYNIYEEGFIHRKRKILIAS